MVRLGAEFQLAIIWREPHLKRQLLLGIVVFAPLLFAISARGAPDWVLSLVGIGIAYLIVPMVHRACRSSADWQARWIFAAAPAAEPRGSPKGGTDAATLDRFATGALWALAWFVFFPMAALLFTIATGLAGWSHWPNYAFAGALLLVWSLVHAKAMSLRLPACLPPTPEKDAPIHHPLYHFAVLGMSASSAALQYGFHEQPWMASTALLTAALLLIVALHRRAHRGQLTIDWLRPGS